MGVDGAGVSVVVIVPDTVQNALARKGNSVIFHEILQELEFLEAEVDRAAVDGNDVSRLVHLDAAGGQMLLHCRAHGAAQDRVDAR